MLADLIRQLHQAARASSISQDSVAKHSFPKATIHVPRNHGDLRAKRYSVGSNQFHPKAHLHASRLQNRFVTTTTGIQTAANERISCVRTPYRWKPKNPFCKDYQGHPGKLKMQDPPEQHLAEDRRKEIFLALVDAQDHEMSVSQSRSVIAQRFQVSEGQVREIE